MTRPEELWTECSCTTVSGNRAHVINSFHTAQHPWHSHSLHSSYFLSKTKPENSYFLFLSLQLHIIPSCGHQSAHTWRILHFKQWEALNGSFNSLINSLPQRPPFALVLSGSKTGGWSGLVISWFSRIILLVRSGRGSVAFVLYSFLLLCFCCSWKQRWS